MYTLPDALPLSNLLTGTFSPFVLNKVLKALYGTTTETFMWVSHLYISKFPFFCFSWDK